MAIKTKNVIISLFSGTFIGVMVLCSYNPMAAIQSMIGDYLFVQLTDSYNAGVIVLLVFIGGFIKLMEKSGGAGAFAARVTAYINILSSTGAGCDLVDHVKTQLPYAALNGGIALIGYIVAGITHSAVSLGIAVLLLAVCTATLSRWYARRI